MLQKYFIQARGIRAWKFTYISSGAETGVLPNQLRAHVILSLFRTPRL